jgi:hypothetical protein
MSPCFFLYSNRCLLILIDYNLYNIFLPRLFLISIFISEGVEQCKEWSSNMTQQIDLAFNIFFMVYFFIRVSSNWPFEMRLAAVWLFFILKNVLDYYSSSPPAINCGSCWRCTRSSTTSRYLPRSCPSTWTGHGSVRSAQFKFDRCVKQFFKKQDKMTNFVWGLGCV